MASGWYVTGLKEVMDGTIDLDNDTLKMMLVDAGYTYDPDHDVVDNGANDATDPSHNEIVATNYTGGFAGSGRKTLTLSISADKTNNRVLGTITDPAWTALGGASNDTVGGGIIIKEITADTSSRVIGFIDVTDFTTNGSDVTFDMLASGSGGNLRVTLA